jgi:hypothetical protein
MIKLPPLATLMAVILSAACAPAAVAANQNNTGIHTALISNGETFIDAQQKCSELRAGGFTDWRLPTLAESKTLHEAGVFYGLSPQSKESWTSTAGKPGMHAIIWMFNGSSNIADDTRRFKVYCVRLAG